MAYAVDIARPAQRQLKKLDAPIRKKLSQRIDALAKEPRPPGVVKLTDVVPPVYRVREGQHRVLYTIDDDVLIVLVVRVAHRKGARHRLPYLLEWNPKGDISCRERIELWRRE